MTSLFVKKLTKPTAVWWVENFFFFIIVSRNPAIYN